MIHTVHKLDINLQPEVPDEASFISFSTSFIQEVKEGATMAGNKK